MANAAKLRIKELQTALGKMGVSTRGMLEKAELVDAYVGALRAGKRPDAVGGGGGVFDDGVVELKTSKMPKAEGRAPAAAGGRPSAAARRGSPFGGERRFGAAGMPNIGLAHGRRRRGSPFGGMGGGGMRRTSSRRPWATRAWPASGGGGATPSGAWAAARMGGDREVKAILDELKVL